MDEKTLALLTIFDPTQYYTGTHRWRYIITVVVNHLQGVESLLKLLDDTDKNWRQKMVENY